MSFEAEMEAALVNFRVEAAELLEAMETGLLALEGGDHDAETVNSVFRAAHTVKGSAGLFGLDDIVSFTHVMESVLDRMRDGEIEPSSAVVGALLPCTDHLGALIARLSGGPEPDPAAGERLLSALTPFLVPGQASAADVEPATENAADGGPAAEAADVLVLSIRFGVESLRNGMDPLSFLGYLFTLGHPEAVRTVHEFLPEADELDAECCHLAFLVALRTDEPLATVLDVFEFVADDSDIRALPAGAPPEDVEALVDSYGELAGVVREFLTQITPVAADETPVPAVPAVPADSVAPVATPAAPGGAARPVPAAPSAEAQSIRVDAGRLDRLVDAVGELVIAGAGAGMRVRTSGDEQLENAFAEVMRLVEEVRDSTLQLRMVPIGTTFSRFQRVVRDVSSALGKEVTLAISGGDTEVDKALVEQIGDPLMHLVRNALDHGVESPQVRRERGKNPRGTLTLNAFHDSGSIVIEIKDDGAGIDAARVHEIAVQRGVIAPGTVLTEQETFALIFEPGFSTAQQVSDLSGRGVGMDVVKRNVTALRGTIDVSSRAGEGTTFRIRLPLTLAIIDGFMVGVGDATYVIPLDRVLECVELPAQNGRQEVMNLRGEALPYVSLRSLFGLPGHRPRRENVVVVEYAGTKTGLVVDTLRGEFQTVIKPLGDMFGQVRGVGGSTILGNGDVALILDIPMLVQHATEVLGSVPA
ncbi:chemotaxis protein CheA [Spongisporangium articulatum]|uniref:Chemotaxis protein CheA n=1 Tax=Spongisporangium articulatum TaxID=3362603 RepID=A0ABW8ANB1_9ACTN